MWVLLTRTHITYLHQQKIHTEQSHIIDPGQKDHNHLPKSQINGKITSAATQTPRGDNHNCGQGAEGEGESLSFQQSPEK